MTADDDAMEIDWRARRQALRMALGAAVEQWAVGQPASELLAEAQLAYDVQVHGRDLTVAERDDDRPNASRCLFEAMVALDDALTAAGAG